MSRTWRSADATCTASAGDYTRGARSEELWGPDAATFNPDRWFEDDAAVREKYLIPFGLGYASCPGQHLARIEISKMAATIVRDYNIQQVEQGQQWKHTAYFSATPHSWPVYIEKHT